MKLTVSVLYPKAENAPQVLERSGENGLEQVILWQNSVWLTLTDDGVIQVFQPNKEYLLKVLTTGGLSVVPSVGSKMHIVGSDPVVFEISSHKVTDSMSNSLEMSENFYFLLRIFTWAK